MRYTWDEHKRQANIRKHKKDFADAETVLRSPYHGLLTREDKRSDYGEQRLVSTGILYQEIVVIVYVETDEETRIISMRKADKHERDEYFKAIGLAG
jgi:uncharacterized DUF497 family protein